MPGCKTCVHEPIHKCSWPGTDCPDWGPKREAYGDLLAACESLLSILGGYLSIRIPYHDKAPYYVIGQTEAVEGAEAVIKKARGNT